MAIQAGGPGLDDARQHLAALHDVEWLLALDELWTSSISAGHQEPSDAGPDFAGLGRLAGDIDEALSAMPDVALHVLKSLERMDDDATDYALGSLREAVPETASVVEWLHTNSAEGSAHMTLIAACTWVLQETEIERGILREKATLLQRKELPDPDIRPLFRCMGSLVGIGAGMALTAAGTVTVLGVPAVVALGGAAYVYGVGTVWEKAGCKTTMRGAAGVLAKLRTV